ncbi:PqqD family peptide modification chaperone, partial [bacterium]|nr:PqqD family peptide modification chaperone [bacterium]
MLVKQSQDTFIRKFGDLGYITNQLTKKDRVYDESGSIFLTSLTRTAKSVDDITNEIFSQFADVSLDQIKPDIIDFLVELHN